MDSIFTKAVGIVNEELKNSHLRTIQASVDEFNILNDGDKRILVVVASLPNFAYKVLDRICKDRRRSKKAYYHFIPLKYGLTSIKKRVLRAYPLIKYVRDDPNEYGGAIGRFNLPEVIEIQGEQYGTIIKEVQEQSYILCFSTDPKNNYFWQRSIPSEPYICLEVIPDFKEEQYRKLFEFREVFYNEEETFAVLNRIVERIRMECSVDFHLAGLPHYAMFSKDSQYHPEKEVRFSINTLYNQIPYSDPEMVYRGIRDEKDFDLDLYYLKIKLFGLNEKPNLLFRSRDDMARFRLKRVLIDEHSQKAEVDLKEILKSYSPTPDVVTFGSIGRSKMHNEQLAGSRHP